MPQGEPRDRCRIIEGWCVAHERKAGHVRPPIEGEVGMDPADRPLPSDEAAEAQYSGRLPAWVATSQHNTRAATAVMDKDVQELARLRAESAAVGALRNAVQVFLVRGRCLQCDQPVSRRLDEQGNYAALLRWEHEDTGRDTQHPVTNVLPPSGTA